MTNQPAGRVNGFRKPLKGRRAGLFLKSFGQSLVAFVAVLSAAPAAAENVVITLDYKKLTPSAQVAKVADLIEKSPLLRGRGIYAPKKRIKTRAEFREAVKHLGHGDVLYINGHGAVIARRYTDGTTVSEPALGLGPNAYFLKDIEADMRAAFRGRPPRLLLAVMDACMGGSRDADYDIAQRAFGAEVILGWRTNIDTWRHIEDMSEIVRKYLYPRGGGSGWARLEKDPGAGTSASRSGRPFAYPREYDGWTLNEVAGELKGGCPTIEGMWRGRLTVTKAPAGNQGMVGKTRNVNDFYIIQDTDPCKVDISFRDQVNYGGMTARLKRKSADLYKPPGSRGLQGVSPTVGVLRYTFNNPNEENVDGKWKRTSNLIWAQIDLYHQGFGKNNDRLMEITIRQEQNGKEWKSRGRLNR